jgi:hypothetical protein
MHGLAGLVKIEKCKHLICIAVNAFYGLVKMNQLNLCDKKRYKANQLIGRHLAQNVKVAYE